MSMIPQMTTLLAAADSDSTTAGTPANPASLDAAFEYLSTYKTGSARARLMAIDDAVTASINHGDAREKLEQRLLRALKDESSVLAKEYVCRKLALIGSAQSVAVLARLLEDKALGESARSALQSLPLPEAHAAVRDTVPKLSGMAKIGALNSLGTWRDATDVSLLATLLRQSDPQIASAAASALGDIGTVKAAEALAAAPSSADENLRLRILDARLSCAERLLSTGNKAEAQAIYKTLSQPEQPKQVQLAAKRGLLNVLQQR